MARMYEQRRDTLLRQLFPGVDDIESLRRAPVPKKVPPGIDLASNLREATGMGPFEFKAAVGNKGRWNYKQIGEEYEDFGNWHYGFVARGLLWLPREGALRAAGWAQSRAGTSEEDWGVWWGSAPYGDDWSDQSWIEKGWDIWEYSPENPRLDHAESDILP